MSARLHNLAWIRFFAIIFVVLIHTSAEFALQEPLSLCWLFSLAVEAVSREGLCLFFVLSGFLLIKEFSSRKEIYSFLLVGLGESFLRSSCGLYSIFIILMDFLLTYYYL